MQELVESASANIPGDADIEIRSIPPSEPEPTTRGFLIFTPDNFSRYGLDQFICNVFASGEGIQRIALKIDTESNKLVEIIVEFEDRYISFLRSYNSYFERVYSDSGVSDYVREVFDNPDEFAVIDAQFERLDKMLRGLLIITKESRIPVDIRQALITLLPGGREEPTNPRYVFFTPEKFRQYGLYELVIGSFGETENGIQGLELQVDLDGLNVVGIIIHFKSGNYVSFLRAAAYFCRIEYYNGTFREIILLRSSLPDVFGFLRQQFGVMDEVIGRIFYQGERL